MDIDKKSLSKYGIEITDYNITASDNEGYGSNFDIEMCLQCGLIEGQSKLTDSITLVSVFYNKDGELVAQVRKSVDSPPGMLTEDHHHTVHEERQVCYSSHLRPKSLHL